MPCMQQNVVLRQCQHAMQARNTQHFSTRLGSSLLYLSYLQLSCITGWPAQCCSSCIQGTTVASPDVHAGGAVGIHVPVERGKPPLLLLLTQQVPLWTVGASCLIWLWRCCQQSCCSGPAPPTAVVAGADAACGG